MAKRRNLNNVKHKEDTRYLLAIHDPKDPDLQEAHIVTVTAKRGTSLNEAKLEIIKVYKSYGANRIEAKRCAKQNFPELF